MLTLLLLACPGDKSTDSSAPPAETAPPADSADTDGGDDTDGGGDTDSGEPAELDPLALAAEVSAARMEASVTALADFGTRHLEAENHAEVRAWLVSELEREGLTVWEHAFEAEGVAAANVVAELPGRDPLTVWIFQAHFDSTSELAPEVAPGANDNATGVAAVLEAARVLKDVPLEATVWLVLTDAEEQGSLGSAALVEDLPALGVSVAGVIAPDMIGYWPKEDGDAFDILGDEDSEALVERMSEVADALGVAHKTWINHRYCYGDDHTNFQEAGIPAIAPMDCVEAHNVPGTDEDWGHYHLSTDTPDAVYFPFTARVTGVIVATLATLASGG